MRRTSEVWQHFEEEVVVWASNKHGAETKTMLRCKACGKRLTKSSDGCMSTMKRHLERCVLRFRSSSDDNNNNANAQGARLKRTRQTTLEFPSATGGDVLPVTPSAMGGDVPPSAPSSGGYDHTTTRKIVATMILVHDLPFQIVDDEWFNTLSTTLNPLYERIERKDARADCAKIFESEKARLRKTFKSIDKISLTWDLWTSNQLICYLSLAAHYVDMEWEMQTRIINFVELDPPYSGAVISDAISECLVEWKIENKVSSITFDDASNNGAAAELLLAKLNVRSVSFFNGILFHVRCCAHILNQLVSDGLKPLEGLISKIRETVKYFKKSNTHFNEFTSIAKSLELDIKRKMCMDVCTGWGSTYKMLDSAFYFKDAIEIYAAQDDSYKWVPQMKSGSYTNKSAIYCLLYTWQQRCFLALLILRQTCTSLKLST